MKIPEEIDGMLKRSEELLLDLSNEYHECISENKITERLKNITHEIIEKDRHILDKIMRIIWNKYWSSNKGQHDIYFPITKSDSLFSKKMSRNKMADLEIKNKALYDYLIYIQPYKHARNDWLSQLTKIAGKGKHDHYKDQKRKDFLHTTITTLDVGTIISWAEPIGKKNAKLDPFKKNLLKNPNLTVERDIGKNIILDDINENVGIYCEILVKKIKKLVDEIFNLL
ncbi:hypothetical protein LCGC14_1743390 [marine sediment metagenome]|uniref:Uncharacterized protein n=1 Tax=marine sediment metagenome TaxID=412755 RepID=A0A0F9H622_9ZZZZ